MTGLAFSVQPLSSAYGVELALLGYSAWAVTNVVDKWLLNDRVPDERAFAFLANALIFVFTVCFAIFYDITLPAESVLMAGIAGGLFYLGLHLYFYALKLGDVVSIVPLTGTGAISALLFSTVLFSDWPSKLEFAGSVILVAGGLAFIGGRPEGAGGDRVLRSIFFVLASSAVLGCSYALQSALYKSAPFEASFFWIRGFAFLASLTVLFSPSRRRELRAAALATTWRGRALFAGNQLLAFVGLLLLNAALVYSPAAVVSALAAIQYVVVLLLSLGVAWVGITGFERERKTATSWSGLMAIGLIVVGTAVVGLGR